MGVLKLTWHADETSVQDRVVDKEDTPWIQIEIDPEIFANAADEYAVFQDAADILGHRLHGELKKAGLI